MIVDINVAHRVFLRDDDVDFSDIYKSLFENRKIKANVVYGGRLLREYRRNNAVMRAIAILDRAARARKINDDFMDNEEARVIASGLCVSDDQHIIALARISDARLLCSHDRGLHSDFTNKALLDKPRGKVYQNASHKPLIQQCCK